MGREEQAKRLEHLQDMMPSMHKSLYTPNERRIMQLRLDQMIDDFNTGFTIYAPDHPSYFLWEGK